MQHKTASRLFGASNIMTGDKGKSNHFPVSTGTSKTLLRFPVMVELLPIGTLFHTFHEVKMTPGVERNIIYSEYFPPLLSSLL